MNGPRTAIVTGASIWVSAPKRVMLKYVFVNISDFLG
jgi:hypothetical protein